MNALVKLNQIEQSAKIKASERNSSRYGHISSLDVVEALADIIDMGNLTVRQGRGRGSFHSITANLRPSLDVQALVGTDYVRPTVHVFNSYAGESPVSIMLGLYRLVCSNGLVVGESIFKAEARHIKGPKLSSVLDGLRAALGQGVDNLEHVFRAVDELDRVRCNRTTLERILDSLNLSYKQYHAALRAYECPTRRADIGDSAWLVFNRVQETLNQNTVKGIATNRDLMQTFIDETGATIAPKKLQLVRG